MSVILRTFAGEIKNSRTMQMPLESLNLLMLNVGLARHNGDWNWQQVNSPFTRIYYVVDGEARLHLGGRSVKLTPRHLYMVPAYTVHSCECTGPFTHYYLHMYEGFKNEMSVLDLYDLPTEVEATADDELLFSRMCQEQPEAQLPASNPQAYDTAEQTGGYMERYRDMALWQKMALRGAILMLFSRFMRQATPRVWAQDERMKRVVAHIHSHISSEVDIQELADLACITKPYLNRLFKREFGTSPVQYINSKKVERAQLLLCTTDMPVKQVAYALGYGDHSYFIRMFRKVSGTTPQEYRKKIKN